MENQNLLEVGRVYKYKELCALFGEEKKDGNSKKSQEKEWWRYFSWTKPTTHKYRIEDIREVLLPEEDGRKNNGGNNTSNYLSLDDVVMGYIEEIEDDEGLLSCTLPQLAVRVGILSEHYQTHKRDVTAFCENNGYSPELVSALIDKIWDILSKNIKASLKRLANEGSLDVESVMVLLLAGGGSVELSSTASDRVIEIENEVCKQMGINRPEAHKDEHCKEFQKKTRQKILEEFEYDTVSHYKIYKIRKTCNEYKRKSEEDKGRLTRKLVISIGVPMLKYACSPDDKTTPDWEREEPSSDVIKNIIELLNYFFVYMNPTSWDEYWNNDELELRDKDRALLFLSQYCLVKMNIDLEKKRIAAGKTKEQVKESKRDLYVAEYGADVIADWERILKTIDWDRCYIDEEYAEKCVDALETYNDTKDLFYYSKEDYIEEYCVYVARLTMQNKADEQIPFYEFVKQFE